MQISIIIPIYNVEKYLARCIDSIICQFSENDGEIILVDDGSTDNSATICQEYSNKYAFIHYFYKQNGGLSSARNYGIKQSKYDYLFFIDSDDFLNPECLGQIKNALEKDTDILTFGVTKYYSEKQRIVLPIEDLTINDGAEAVYYILDKTGADTYACNKIFRKAFFTRQFPEGKLYEDMYTIPKLFAKGGIFKFISYSGYCYYINPTSITSSQMSLKQFHNIFARTSLLTYLQENNIGNKKLYGKVNEAVVNGFIATGYKILNANNYNPNYYKRLRKMIFSYIKRDTSFFFNNASIARYLALFLLTQFPSLFLFLYRMRTKR